MIVGPSGCGKTTLLSVIAGTLECDAGEINVFGSQLNRLNTREVTEFRKKNVGFIFQQFNLIHAQPVENVSVPLLINGVRRGPRKRKRGPCWTNWDYRDAEMICRPIFRAGSNNAWPSPARWCMSRGS